jgi:GT2 family glycosyltransferase/glycosyltransferase involved in cell wall biosynthesis
MENTPDVSIIIVSYNVAGLLEECLRSIFGREQDSLSVEVIVVDNASRDGSAGLVRERFPQVKLIENVHNYGFPRGCNQGLRAASGRYLFFLNPDAKLEPGALSKLVGFLEQQPEAGIVGPQLRYPDGSLQPNRRRFPGRSLAFVESTILQRYQPFKNWSTLRRFYCEDLPLDQQQQVDWLVGAAFVVRQEVVEQIGGLDERFFMYSEELDFCKRARAKGWQVWYLPKAVVTHQEGRSSAQDVPFRHINFQTSKVSYYRKHYGRLFAEVLRLFLLGTYLFQFAEEGAKLLLRHKPELRRERLAMIRKVLASGLRPYRSPYPHSSSELEICLVSAEYTPQPGGVGDYAEKMFQVLSSEFRVGGVRVLSGLGAMGENTVRLPSDRWNWRMLGQVARHLEERPADAVIIQYQTGAYHMHPAINFLPLYLRWRMGSIRPKVVTTFHDLLVPYLFPKAGRVRQWVNQLLLRTSDRAIVTNQEDYEKALSWGARPEKLSLIPIGSNISPVYDVQPASEERCRIRQEVRQDWGLAENEFAIGYFGLLNRSKGVDTLLEALAKLRNGADGEDWRLIIIGGETGQTDQTNRPYARELEKLITSLGLEKAVIRTGHLSAEATSRAFAGLDVMALPFRDGASFRRGSLLAPLAHGVPIITTTNPKRDPQLGGETPPLQSDTRHPTPDTHNSHLATNYANIPDGPQLLHRKSVVYIEPENPDALAKALRELRTNDELRGELSQGALELSRHFRWEAIAGKLLEILE